MPAGTRALDVDLDRAVDAAVADALAGRVPLETGISRALFGCDPEQDEAPWPREAMEIWCIAVDRWTLARAGSDRRRLRHRSPPTLSRIWREIERVTRGRDPWWETNVSWPQLAARIGFGDRATAYIMEQLGFRIEGRGDARRFTAVVCTRCRNPVPPRLIASRRCPSCQ